MPKICNTDFAVSRHVLPFSGTDIRVLCRSASLAFNFFDSKVEELGHPISFKLNMTQVKLKLDARLTGHLFLFLLQTTLRAGNEPPDTFSTAQNVERGRARDPELADRSRKALLHAESIS